jgi:hypothetical protein
MLISRIVSLVLAVALIDIAAASLTSVPLVRWSSLVVGVLYAIVAVFGFRRVPAVTAATGLLALAGLFALSEYVAGADGGLAATGLSAGTTIALGIAIAILLCGLAASLSHAPVPLRAAGAIVAVVAAVPFGLAAKAGSLGAAFTGAPAWLAWAAVEILLPLAALGAVAVAGTDIFHRRWTDAAAATIAGLALLACVQAGAHAAGLHGMPSITAFEGATAAATQTPGTPG